MQSPWPGTGVLPGKSLEVPREVLPGGSGESGCSGGCSRGCSGAPGGAPEGALPVELLTRHPQEHSLEHPWEHLSTLESTPQSTPISQSTPGSTSRSTSRDFSGSTPVPGQGDCNFRLFSNSFETLGRTLLGLLRACPRYSFQTLFGLPKNLLRLFFFLEMTSQG